MATGTYVFSALQFILMTFRVESTMLSRQPSCAGRWVCQGGFQCVNYEKICDGVLDCPFGDDEIECSCTSDADCPEEATCVTMEARGRACRRDCPRGLKNYLGRCVDEDECSSGNHTCPASERCINTLGSYRCDCRPGYARNSTSNVCDDIDECAGPEAECTSPLCENTEGSFKCPCPADTEVLRSFDPKIGAITLGCSQTNYCRNSSCEAPRICKINLGMKEKYECVCPVGYLEQNGTCIDVNECLTVGNMCDRVVRTSEFRLRCHNMDGNYACRCPLSTKAIVVDNYVFIDVCKLSEAMCGPRKCPKHSSCEHGICICEVGYQWNNRRCVDLDECAYEAHECPRGTVCINESPGYACACPPGFRLESLKGTTPANSSVTANATRKEPETRCVDIDECAEGVAECQHACENTNGSYTCNCPSENVRIDRYCYPSRMPRQIIQLDENVLRFGTLEFNDLSIDVKTHDHSCTTSQPKALAYDQSHRKIFYLSSDRSTIFHDNEQLSCNILVSGRTNITHIAIDYEFENMYWIEGSNLYVKSVLTGQERLLKEFNETFRSMMVDPAEGHVSLVGEERVYRVDLDGTHVDTYYENSNVSRIFLDADGSPIYLANDTLIACPTMGAPMEICSTLNISASNKRVLGVYMNFVLLINEKNLLEVVSENTRSEFLFRMKYSENALFEVVQTYRKVNSTHLCQYCGDICLNSASTAERCRCGDSPCGNLTASLRDFFPLNGWKGLLVLIPAVSTVAVIMIAFRRLKRTKRFLDIVGFDSSMDNVSVEPPQTVTPCIDVSMKSQLIENP